MRSVDTARSSGHPDDLAHATARPYSYSHYIHFHSCLDLSPDNLERLRHAERASYATHHVADDDQPHGCMVDLRVKIIAYLRAWA